MEECCAVCAEPLEWIGYGPCGHREVCFACISRLRVVLNDKRCCICKQDCPTVFITKALGEYTRTVTDWEALPSLVHAAGPEKVLYDNVVGAYFDDEEPFKIIRAMCRLSCVICEKAAGEDIAAKGFMKKGHIFRNIDALRRHLYNSHKVSMCELCLEGRKVFICEQKLYSKSQLERHSYKGDSEVDGSEEERGGFAGHPVCDFCQKRFYGDNELYQHMSQEHYTCHMCQRARPGQYEYYRNYDDLERLPPFWARKRVHSRRGRSMVEAHFRQEHSLCEHPDCLAKKFVVFPSEAELKRHNATTHGGNMSRAQRNAALQIPVSFQYRRPGQDSSDDNNGSYASRRVGRGRHMYPTNSRNDQLNAAVRASVESADLEEAVRESLVTSSSNDAPGSSHQGAPESQSSVDVERSTSPGDADRERSRYLTAVWGGGPSALGDAAFPPLPGTSKNERRKHKAKTQGPQSMAAMLGGGSGSGMNTRGGIRVLNAAGDYRPQMSSHIAPTSSQPPPSAVQRPLPQRPLPPSGLEMSREQVVPRLEGFSSDLIRRDEPGQVHPGNAVPTPNPPSMAMRGPASGDTMIIGGNRNVDVMSNNLGNLNLKNGLRPGLVGVESEHQSDKAARLNMEDIRAANRALVERIRAGLVDNEQQFSNFKEVSSLFRKGEMSSQDYYIYIARLGLSYVVPELARLCPDPRKGKELMEAHIAQLANNVVAPTNMLPGQDGAFSRLSVHLGGPSATFNSQGSSSSSDIQARPSSSSGTHSRAHPDHGAEAEVLSTDGYRRQKGKSRMIDSKDGLTNVSHQVMPSTEGTLLNELVAARDRNPQVLVRAFPPLLPESAHAPVVSDNSSAPSESVWACELCTLENSYSSTQCAACGTARPGEEAKGMVDPLAGIEKKKKKTPKFQRLRLGDLSASGLLDSTPSNPWGQTTHGDVDIRNLGRSHGRGVWNNGGGQRLVSMVQRESVIDDAWNQGK